jgi:hypothetical protein
MCVGADPTSKSFANCKNHSLILILYGKVRGPKLPKEEDSEISVTVSSHRCLTDDSYSYAEMFVLDPYLTCSCQFES